MYLLVNVQKINCEIIIFSNPDEQSIAIKAVSDMCSTQTLLQMSSDESEVQNSLQIKKQDEDINQEFSLAYILIFLKLYSISKTVHISISQHTPIMFHYEFPIGTAHFYVAPKFDD